MERSRFRPHSKAALSLLYDALEGILESGEGMSSNFKMIEFLMVEMGYSWNTEKRLRPALASIYNLLAWHRMDAVDLEKGGWAKVKSAIDRYAGEDYSAQENKIIRQVGHVMAGMMAFVRRKEREFAEAEARRAEQQRREAAERAHAQRGGATSRGSRKREVRQLREAQARAQATPYAQMLSAREEGAEAASAPTAPQQEPWSGLEDWHARWDRKQKEIEERLRKSLEESRIALAEWRQLCWDQSAEREAKNAEARAAKREQWAREEAEERAQQQAEQAQARAERALAAQKKQEEWLEKQRANKKGKGKAKAPAAASTPPRERERAPEDPDRAAREAYEAQPRRNGGQW